MRVIDAGHGYELAALDGNNVQTLQFVKREGPKFPGNVGHYSGTTMQEVLRALIDRAAYVNNQIPCWQTRASMYLMGLCVWLFEQRAAKRHGRKSPTFSEATFGTCCVHCGHVGCLEAQADPRDAKLKPVQQEKHD